MQSYFEWVVPPDEISQGMEQYGERVLIALQALGQYIADRLQNYSRTNAPWTDRTGNARSGLFAVAEQAAGDFITIYLSHGNTVDYGKWLELANAGKYAIIMPTLEIVLPEAKRMLDEIFRD